MSKRVENRQVIIRKQDVIIWKWNRTVGMSYPTVHKVIIWKPKELHEYLLKKNSMGMDLVFRLLARLCDCLDPGRK